MTVHHLNGRFAFDGRSPGHRAMVAGGLWLRAGFVALIVEAIALIMLATGEAAPWIAIAAAVVAGVFARWSWSKARIALDAEAAATSSSATATASKPRVQRSDGRVETGVTR
jgi:membrane protein implicated in regulation of membrane protease activity